MGEVALALLLAADQIPEFMILQRDEIDDVIRRHRAAQDDALAAWERRQALASA